MTSSQDQVPATVHSTTIQSLPWLVSGTLDDAQAAAARAHLDECAECREWLDFDQTLANAVHEDQSVEFAPHTAYARFTNRLDAIEARRGRWRDWLRLLELPRVSWGAGPRPLHLLVAAQTTAILLLATVLVVPRIGSPPLKEYQTLSQAEPVAASGATFRVVVDDAMSARELRELLGRIDGRIVAGPTELGVFTIEIDGETSTDREPVALAKWLRNQPGVRFAEPVEASVR